MMVDQTVWRGAVRAVCVLAMVAITTPSIAQFSNDWINFGQTYYKIPVAQTGIYKLTYADLQAAGLPLSGIDPRRINLFHRGKEQAIFVSGENDAVFDPSDFIEFYGRKNDGTLDADLYKPNAQPHTLYNLYSDTAAYFLTWNPLPVLGRRMTLFSQPNPGGMVKDDYAYEDKLVLQTVSYADGYTLGGEIQDAAFDLGEGWTGSPICVGASGCTGFSDITLSNLTGTFTSANGPVLEVLLVGQSDQPHTVNIYAGPTGGSAQLVTTTTINGYGATPITLGLDWSAIGVDGKLVVRTQLVSSGVRDQISVSYVKLTYARNFDLAGVSEKTLDLQLNSNGQSYAILANPPANARVWDITNPQQVGQLGTTTVPGGIGVVVDGTNSQRTIYVAGNTRSATIRKVTFRPIQPTTAEYVVVTHRLLRKSALGYPDPVRAYAGYRASATGGHYDTLVMNIDQLYDQFNYGETSPRAIYQFAKYLVNGGHTRFLFLVGKGLDVTQGFYRNSSITPADFHDLVPTAGWPASDMVFSAGLKGVPYVPAIPTGRLTASTADQVAGYLNKIKETEAAPFDAMWRKNLLHLSGGIHEGEPAVFRSYTDGFKSIAEGFYLGGRVETIGKQSLNVELVNVKDQVNHGLNLITFFGHSGPGTIDIDIGNVSDPKMAYNNKGKYPGFLINGCNAGQFFSNRTSFGEDWMLTPGKGARLFIAHSSFGFTTSLKQYSDIFYSVAYGDSIFQHRGIGEVQQEVAIRYLASGTDLMSTTQVQQMVLLGDPAVPLFGATAPDYEINSGTVFIQSLDGKPVSALTKSFAINFTVRNFGRAQQTPLAVRITRTLSDNTTIVTDTTYTPVLYQDVLQFVIKRGRSDKEFGQNGFTIELDPGHAIKELNETNNKATIGFFVPANGTRNIFPANYAIVNKSTIELLFQNTDLMSGSRAFQVEVDTAATFNSPYLKRQVVTGKVLARVPISLLSSDSTTYFWRTRLANPQSGESTSWMGSSFSYIKQGAEGWAQLSFAQTADNALTGLIRNEGIRRLVFPQTASSLNITTFGSANANPFTNVSLKLNGDELNIATQEQPCRNNSLNLLAFDKFSSAPYAGINFENFFDPRACGRAPQVINNFLSNELETGTNDLLTWISHVKAGDSVLLYSMGDAGYASWSTNVQMALTQLGIGLGQLSTLSPGEPFIIFGMKGAPANAAKVVRPTALPVNAQSLSANRTITGRRASGSMASVTIGPAQVWSQLTQHFGEVGPSDKFSVSVEGLDINGNATALKTAIGGNTLLTDISAASYPYLRLNLSSADSVDLSPVRLRHWLVSYTPMAEGMLTYHGIKSSEVLQEGQSWSATYGFANLSTVSFTDSITVSVDIFSTDAGARELNQFRIKAPAPSDTTHFTVRTSTLGKAGGNDVTVFANPRILPEPGFDNNVLSLQDRLQVNQDRTPPVLDVTIDGRTILNGDVVASSPQILIRVRDANPFRLKTDTIGIDLFLQYPCTRNCVYRRVVFSDKAHVQWHPATASSDFSVEINPTNLQPGAYRLSAQAVDGSGNSSGPLPYEVSFVVEDTNGFAVKSVYPNPASDLFRFTVELQALVDPSDYSLQLFSATGSLMRELSMADLPVLHPGTNTLVLPATDSFGNPLFEGVYVYRLTVNMPGQVRVRTGRLVVQR
ncbi:MAG TPA: C25 family cysteine peptidase [Cyclobacteriaceae bacterium]|nr:C25 family cysteine peptidase [Cyclobacteriaceae bacterium]